MTPRREFLPAIRAALAGRYEVDREIARGGAARVYAGRAPGGHPVAVKILHPELAVSVTAERFLREVQFLRRITHPHIGRVLDSGEADYLLYFVMDWIEGPTLRQHVEKVAIVPGPASDEVSPGFLLVILRFHPLLLRVAGEFQARFELGAHKALMIVGRRVDQVPEDLLLGPSRG